MGDEGDTGDDSTRFIPVGGNDETRFTGVAAPAPAPAPAPAAGAKPDATLPPGSLLGHTYRIEAFLARGGMGEVYRARHAELNTEHAIKIILPELANNQRIVDLFRREASVLRNVRHDAVVAYDGVFRDENGRLYLVMEFADGPSLSTLMRNRPLDADEVRQLRDRLADGLAVAHDKGVIHRDISPDNVILPGSDLGKAKIIDFGISKAVDPEVKTIIGDDFAGKFSYVSPEQLGMFGGQIDGRSDIYSLGLVLAAAAQGEPLDMGLSPISVIEARRAIPDLSRVPEAVRADLAAMLQPDPAKRPQSMHGLIRPQEQRGGGRSTQPDTSRQRSAATRGGGRIGAVQIAGALAVLVAAGGALGYWYWKGRGAGDATVTTQLADSSGQQSAGSATSSAGAADTPSAIGQTTQQSIAAVTSDQAQAQTPTASTSEQGADAGATPAQQLEGTAGTTTLSSTAGTAGDTGQANQSNTETAATGAGESTSTTQDGTTAAAAGDVHSQSQSSQDGASAATVTTATDQSGAAADQQSASTMANSGAGTSDQSPTKTETTGAAISSKVADQSTDAATSNSNAADTAPIVSGAATGKTATDTQTALLPQVPDVAKLRNDAARAIQGLSCAGIRVDVSDAGGIAASGYVASEADRNKAAALLAALPNAGQVDNAVAVMTPPLCQVLDVLRAETAFALGTPGLDPGGVSGVYREGDHIKVAVTAPAGFDGYLYVDYIDSTDRYVLHLLPNNDFRKNNRVSAGERIVIGSLPAEYDLYVIQPPFGTNLIIAVTSRQPLFDRMRKTQESVDEYLPALRSSLKRIAAEGGSAGLAAAYSSVVLRAR